MCGGNQALRSRGRHWPLEFGQCRLLDGGDRIEWRPLMAMVRLRGRCRANFRADVSFLVSAHEAVRIRIAQAIRSRSVLVGTAVLRLLGPIPRAKAVFSIN